VGGGYVISFRLFLLVREECEGIGGEVLWMTALRMSLKVMHACAWWRWFGRVRGGVSCHLRERKKDWMNE
jgi:hypothetical protein